MRTVGVIVAAVALACAASMPREQATAPTFEEFKAAYGRTYQTPQEEAKRRGIYVATLQRIKRARVANPFATFGVNELADRDPKDIVGKVRPAKNGRRAAVPAAAPVRGGIPKEVDWRARGAVTPVVNEGVCGSIICGLTFAANVEGVWAASGLPLTPLSVMPGMMCADPGLCGCFLRDTYEYFLNNQSGFVQTAASWPMNTSQCEATGQCRRDDRHYGARIRSVVQLASNEDIMAESVANNGPITVEVNALPWQTYTGGVMTECACDDPQPDHVGTIVGYNDAHQPPYWIIKNSWGTSWGENGYIYLEKGKGLCNVTVAPMTVTV